MENIAKQINLSGPSAKVAIKLLNDTAQKHLDDFKKIREIIKKDGLRTESACKKAGIKFLIFKHDMTEKQKLTIVADVVTASSKKHASKWKDSVFGNPD